ncbi:exopolysaccharide biosynthesis protein [Rhodovibrio salinarum]|uniref:exopolysaccharide biosynthesis protein n=1 Tax=Rhodovibrio salinarum TaxID=1087 RepID=UPI0004B583BA|nr:exopolysaccharide biosynthesis protein [Rhodovibrio salinarum]
MEHQHNRGTAPSTADLLETFPRLFNEQRIPLRRLLDALGDRGMASALLLLTAPQLLPLPLGVSNALALPIVLIALQMAAGNSQPWLPEWVLNRPVTRDKVLGACRRMVPMMRRIERVIRPRWRHIWQPPGDRLVGLCCVVISLVSLAPLPLTGWLPGAALLIVALGLLERDGMIVASGLAVGAGAVAVFVAVVAGLVEAGETIQQEMSRAALGVLTGHPLAALTSGLPF